MNRVQNFRRPLALLLLVGFGGGLCGCAGSLRDTALFQSRRERLIAEKIKNDPFPTAIEAGLAPAAP